MAIIGCANEADPLKGPGGNPSEHRPEPEALTPATCLPFNLCLFCMHCLEFAAVPCRYSFFLSFFMSGGTDCSNSVVSNPITQWPRFKSETKWRASIDIYGKNLPADLTVNLYNMDPNRFSSSLTLHNKYLQNENICNLFAAF